MNTQTSGEPSVGNGGTDSTAEFSALQTVITALQPLESEARHRIFEAVSTFLGLDRSRKTLRPVLSGQLETESQASNYPMFSADTSMSPKEFMLQKQPRTDVERIACLAYYLRHYRDLPHFKTLDLSKLNTEAAQPKFANAASSANNAVKRGYLVPSTKGSRQISAAGEQFVLALPDREAARAAMTAIRPRRKNKKTRPVSSVGQR